MMRIGKDENYTIWDQAKSTDPKWTKPFPKFGKTLTTIDPMSQIMCMTGLFGPVGKGWRFVNAFTYTDQNVFAEVKVQWKDNDTWYSYGPIASVCALYKKYVSEMKEKYSSNGSADNVKVIDPKNLREVKNDQ